MRLLAILALEVLMSATLDAATTLDQRIDDAAKKVEAKVIACRRDIHEHPELGNRETRTSKIIADRLRELGIEVKTPVAHTGVIGLLRGGKPGRVVALRADMDALPVVEQVDLHSSRPCAQRSTDMKSASCTPADTTRTWPFSSA